MSRAPTGPPKRLPFELGDTFVDVSGEGANKKAPSRDPLTAMSPGALFAGRYEILESIGQGGMGEVFRARDERVGDTVALKRLRLLSSDLRNVERFRREVRLARRVSHRNVARIYDLGEDEGVLFLSMEYIQGRDLEQRRREEGPFAPEEVIRIGLSTAEGLEAAHAAGVIHQDLKPANIMQDVQGRIIITDFGIAAGLDDAGGESVTSELLGSPAYMAPERVESAQPDQRSDIYSLGVILYELLSGTLPFEAKTPLAMATARLHSPPRPLPEGARRPPALASLILACLARDPLERPASATELREALERMAPRAQESDTPSPSVTTNSLYAPMLREEPTIRVRPFQYRGPADTGYLGDGIAEELIDTLSRTKGLRVIASVSQEDGADEEAIGVLVDGTVHRQGNRFRIIARLTNVETKTQLWSEVFQGEFEDLFVAEELIARRVAESLRIQVQTAAQHQRIPPEAVQLYLKARKQFRIHRLLGDDGAIALLEQCLELAPELTPATAWYALAIARSFWDRRAAAKLTLADAEEQVQRALREAPAQAETHLAAAVLSSQRGDYSKTAQHLADCLEIAPTCAEAHAYLGELQCATGRQAEGRERLRLAQQLDPTLGSLTGYSLLRAQAFSGDWAAVETSLQAQIGDSPVLDIASMSTMFRFGMWAGREEWLERVAQWVKVSSNYSTVVFDQGLRYVRGTLDAGAFDDTIRSFARDSASLRFRALLLQVAAEVHCYAGDEERALVAIEDAVASTLNDCSWIENCPLLAILRPDARFQRLAEIMRKRAAAIWLPR